MDLSEFERRARRVFEQVPEHFREGVEGLIVSDQAPSQTESPDVYTLGECSTEEHVSDFGGPETTRSIIVLYWGSFRELSIRDPDFDWDAEIWETITHELRHHLEALAGEAALEGLDYAVDQTFKRMDGQPFDPWYFEQGEDVGGGVYRVEGNWFIEQMWVESDFFDAAYLSLLWDGREYRVPRPSKLGDVHFVLLRGLDLDDQVLELVLVRTRTWWEGVRRLVGTSRAVVHESEGNAELVAFQG